MQQGAASSAPSNSPGAPQPRALPPRALEGYSSVALLRGARSGLGMRRPADGFAHWRPSPYDAGQLGIFSYASERRNFSRREVVEDVAHLHQGPGSAAASRSVAMRPPSVSTRNARLEPCPAAPEPDPRDLRLSSRAPRPRKPKVRDCRDRQFGDLAGSRGRLEALPYAIDGSMPHSVVEHCAEASCGSICLDCRSEKLQRRGRFQRALVAPRAGRSITLACCEYGWRLPR